VYAYKQLSKLLKIHFLFRLFLKLEKYSISDSGKSEHKCTHSGLDFVTRDQGKDEYPEAVSIAA